MLFARFARLDADIALLLADIARLDADIALLFARFARLDADIALLIPNCAEEVALEIDELIFVLFVL